MRRPKSSDPEIGEIADQAILVISLEVEPFEAGERLIEKHIDHRPGVPAAIDVVAKVYYDFARCRGSGSVIENEPMKGTQQISTAAYAPDRVNAHPVRDAGVALVSSTGAGQRAPEQIYPSARSLTPPCGGYVRSMIDRMTASLQIRHVLTQPLGSCTRHGRPRSAVVAILIRNDGNYAHRLVGYAVIMAVLLRLTWHVAFARELHRAASVNAPIAGLSALAVCVSTRMVRALAVSAPYLIWSAHIFEWLVVLRRSHSCTAFKTA